MRLQFSLCPGVVPSVVVTACVSLMRYLTWHLWGQQAHYTHNMSPAQTGHKQPIRGSYRVFIDQSEAERGKPISVQDLGVLANERGQGQNMMSNMGNGSGDDCIREPSFSKYRYLNIAGDVTSDRSNDHHTYSYLTSF